MSCGDGVIDAGEECDDGNTQTETVCAYGEATCQRCDSNCFVVLLTGNVCGDGVIAPSFEVCDDDNADACGTCNADCSELQSATAATGLIVAVAGSNLRNELDGVRAR